MVGGQGREVQNSSGICRGIRWRTGELGKCEVCLMCLFKVLAAVLEVMKMGKRNAN